MKTNTAKTTEPNTTDTIAPITHDPLRDAIAAADEAREQHATLERDAATAQQAADVASAAFKRTPRGMTPDGKSTLKDEADITAVEAVNAREAVAQHAETIKPVLEAEKRERHVARLAELRLTQNPHNDIAATGARVVRLFEEFQAALAAEFHALGRSIGSYSARRTELNNLERLVGDGREHPDIALSSALAQINERVITRMQTAYGLMNRGFPRESAAHLTFGNLHQSNAIMSATVRFVPGQDSGLR